MKSYIKKHLRELIWFSFLNDTQIFLSHEFLEILFICYKKKKTIMDENDLKLILEKTVYESIEKDEEGELKWINVHNNNFRILIKNDIMFLKNRSQNINKKWFIVPYQQLIKMTYVFNFEEEDIDFFKLILEIDSEYKKMLLKCAKKNLVLEDEVYSILNVNTDTYFEDIESVKNYSYEKQETESWDDEEWDEPEGDESALYESIQDVSPSASAGASVNEPLYESIDNTPPIPYPVDYNDTENKYIYTNENNNLTTDELANVLKKALSNRINISMVPEDND